MGLFHTPPFCSPRASRRRPANTRNRGCARRLSRVTASPCYGAAVSGRAWSHGRFGVQFDLSRTRMSTIGASEQVTMVQFAPSMLYSLPDRMSDYVWVRPYVGGGAIVHRASVYQGTSTVADSPSRQGLGLQGFGGVETTIAGLPQFAVSADLGYLWSETSLMDIAPRKFRFAFSGHWYVK